VTQANGGIVLSGGTQNTHPRAHAQQRGCGELDGGQISTGQGAIFNNQAGASFETNFDGPSPLTRAARIRNSTTPASLPRAVGPARRP
jgi:hypothetical protein